MKLCRLSSRCSESFKFKAPASHFHDNFRDFLKHLLHEACSGSFFAYQTTFDRKSSGNYPQMAPKADDNFPFGAPVVTKVSRCTENMLPELQKSQFCTPKGAQMTPILENFMQNEARKLVPNVEHPVNSSDC